MGSLKSPPRAVTAPPSPYNSSSQNRVFAAFRFREAPGPGLNMSIRIECYDPSQNTWNYVTSIPGLIENHGLKDFAMVSLDGSIYIIGGILFHQFQAPTSSEDEPNSPAELDVQVLPSVLRYNVRTDQWSECAPLAIPRYDFAYVVCDNKIYVAGGKSTLSSATGVSSAEMYEPGLDEWTPLPDMSTLRYKCAGVTWHGKIHVVGGFAVKEGSGTNPLNFTAERSSAEVYNMQDQKWDLVATMWPLDVPPNQIVAINGRLLSSGDCLKVWKGHVEAYDWEQNIWNEVEGSRLQTLNCPISNPNSNNEMSRALVQQLYLTIAPVGKFLYFLAGYRLDGDIPRTKSIVHRFDTSATNNAWTSFEPMEEEGEKLLCSHCCAVQLS